VIGMATGFLIVLTVVLIAAACYVGLLLVRRSRPATQTPPTPTVGDLVRRRSAPPEEDLSGTDLFAPNDPRTVGAAVPPADGPESSGTGPSATGVVVPHPAFPPAATPPGGVEAGDAPWRRAARMMGSEPGAAWETAPVPVVPAVQPVRETAQAGDPVEAGRTAVLDVPAPVGSHRVEAAPAAVVAVPVGSHREEAGTGAVVAVPEQADAPVDEPSISEADGPLDVRTSTGPVPVTVHEAPAHETPADEAPADETPADETASHETPAVTAVAAVPTPVDPTADDAPAAPSRPLSDPDLTPLMGIPVIRPVAEAPAPQPGAVDVRPEPEPERQPVTPRLSRPSTIDDEVVSFLPANPAPPAAVTGSPQPVWFRVVRRDGEPVEGVVVTLLDDHGREADVTKTATDGGGELHAPHGGWFLMIASADGFQPRAVTLAVDERPVEIALLLPRSATVAGAVRDEGAPVAGTRVVAFQEGEVVDEFVTDRDGGFRFDDLAEGVYAVSASGARGSAVGRVTLTEGADVQLDLDLRRP
jgi:hypothetical protein